MAWSDKPTYNQINTVYRWISWVMPAAEAQQAMKFAEEHFDRKIMSEEMDRIKRLKDSQQFNKNNVFASSNWEGFDYEPTDQPEEMNPAEYIRLFGLDAFVRKERAAAMEAKRKAGIR